MSFPPENAERRCRILPRPRDANEVHNRSILPRGNNKTSTPYQSNGPNSAIEFRLET